MFNISAEETTFVFIGIEKRLKDCKFTEPLKTFEAIKGNRIHSLKKCFDRESKIISGKKQEYS